MITAQALPKVANRFYPEVSRYLNLITIQSKALDQNGVPEETLTLQVPSNAPLSLQEVRKAYWEKRWSHRLVEHTMIDTVNRHNEF